MHKFAGLFVLIILCAVLLQPAFGSTTKPCCQYTSDLTYSSGCGPSATCSNAATLYAARSATCNTCASYDGSQRTCTLNSYLRCYTDGIVPMQILTEDEQQPFSHSQVAILTDEIDSRLTTRFAHSMHPLQTWQWIGLQCQGYWENDVVATTSAQISCEARCNGGQSCLSPSSPSACSTCEACTINQVPACTGYARGWTNGAGGDYQFSSPSCPIPTSVSWPDTCGYAWSFSSSFIQTTAACPSFNNCGACPNSVDFSLYCLKVVTPNGAGGTTYRSVDASYCAGVAKPSFSANSCENRWSALPYTYATPPASTSVTCPTPTTCGTCVDNANIRCIAVQAGTNTFVTEIGENQCTSGKPSYAAVPCNYRCRGGNAPVTCPADGSQTCPCSNPTSCTFTTQMECYNEVTTAFVSSGCSGNSIYSYSGATANCDVRWSYIASPPWDFTGLCPDPHCSQSCPTTLLAANVKCVSSYDGGVTFNIVADSTCVTALGAKPTVYTPHTSCSWVCTAGGGNTEAPCDSSLIPACTSCKDAESVSYIRTKCKNTANGVIADPVGGWCGGNAAAISIPRSCPTCSWLCADPTNAALPVPCASITVSNYPSSPLLQCVSCAGCTKSFESQCWRQPLGGSSGGFISDFSECTTPTTPQPNSHDTPGNPHSCSWRWVLDDHVTLTDSDDEQFKQLCPRTDCKPCDQTISQSCWDDTTNTYVADPTDQCTGTGGRSVIQGTMNCPAPCPTCGWGCLSSSGAYKPCTDAEFTKQCPTPGDVSCTCAIQRIVKCVDYQSSTQTSTTTLAANLNACDGQAKPDPTFVYDRQKQCNACWKTHPYWTGIDCSVGPKIDNFSLSASSAFNFTPLTDDVGEELSYNDSVQFTWEYSGLQTNIATITMTSTSISPLTSITISSFLASSNSFTLNLSTLPFNTKLENVQFYVTIGANIVRTPTLPSPIGYTITHRCANNACQHSSTCNEATGACDCDQSTIWTRGVFCEQSTCSALDCVSSNVMVDNSTGDVCAYKAEFDGQTNPPLQCNCKSSEISGERCQNECSTTMSCPTDTGRAELKYTPSPTDPNTMECSCACLGGYSGANCSRCGLECANGGRSSSRCRECVCPYAGSSSYFWFGKTCNCRAFSLKLTLKTISPDLYSVLELGYTLFSETVSRVLDESSNAEPTVGDDDDAIATDHDRDIFNLTSNGQMKAFMTSLLLSLLTDYYDTLIKLNGLQDSDLFVKDARGQYVLNAQSITNVVSIRSMVFTSSPQSVAITMVIVPKTCSQAGDTTPINNDAWSTTAAVVNYMKEMLGSDDSYAIEVVDPDCFGTICQFADPPPTNNENENSALLALPPLPTFVFCTILLIFF